jgi:AcrR family transcriptional regulator
MPYLSDEARDDRRRKFVEAAKVRAAEVGYRNLTIDDVCRVAGVSKGSFYVHFRSKEDLLIALLDDDAARVDRHLHQSKVNGVDGVRRFLARAIRDAQDGAAAQMRVDSWAEVLISPALSDRYVQTLAERRQLLAEQIDDAIRQGACREVPANAMAAIVLAIADGLMLHHALDPTGFRWVNVRRALNALLTGLEPTHPR